MIYSKLFTSCSNATTYEVDIISSVVPVRELGIKEAGSLPKVALLEFELRAPTVESFFLSAFRTHQYLLRSGTFTPLP